MMYENDKLNIPEKYRNMSVSELRCEKEKVYAQIKKNTSDEVVEKSEYKRKNVKFNFQLFFLNSVVVPIKALRP